MEKLRYIDLFCGIGGFRIATELDFIHIRQQKRASG